MDSERWKRIQGLFDEVADRPRAAQRAVLEAACHEDAALMADVLALLDEDAHPGSILDGRIAPIAAQIFDSPPIQLSMPEQFGPYEIKRVIGEGGMGVVYLAERKNLGRLVAIKVLRDAWASPARRERFGIEERTLAKLNHPLIARLYDADTLGDGTPFFVMEYVEGIPITDHCRDLSIEQRLRLFRAVCDPVQYAHQHAVIHRDLKPSNILVKGDGSVRLLDFGIAKHLEGLDASADQTRTALRLMTPAYAAPEQVKGGQIGVFTDVYALGVLLYQLLTGCLPMDLASKSLAEGERAIVEDEPEKPSIRAGRKQATNRSAWADLDVLCLTAMHKDQRRRYSSVEAMARDVDHFLNGEPLEARPDSFRYKLGKFVRRRRRALSTAAAVLAVMIGLVAYFTLRLGAARDAAVRAANRTERVQRFMMNLFAGGDSQVGPSNDLRVVTLIDRGATNARTLNADPELQAELYQTLGTIYQQLGLFDKAEAMLGEALRHRRSRFGTRSAEASETLASLAGLRIEEARFEEAEQLARQSLDTARSIRPKNPVLIAKATGTLGRVFAGRAEYAKAKPLLEEAVRLLSTSGPPTPELVRSIGNLADATYYAGKRKDVEALNQRALALSRQLMGERHPFVAESLLNLGTLQLDRGNYKEAERFYREALAIVAAWYGKDHHETAAALMLVAQALSAQNRLDEAAELLEEALPIRERVYGSSHPRFAFALNEAGVLAFKLGKLDEAAVYFRRVLEIYRATYGDRHNLVGVALANLGSVYLEKKRYARAERLLSEAVRVDIETLSAGNKQTAIAQIKLGRMLAVQKRYVEAEPVLLAGYQALRKQSNPSVSWLKSAREDLIQTYQALQQPEKAKPFAAEQDVAQ